ncbi:MAG: conjugal transfer protein TraH [Rhodocyclaceae bacterium]
MKRFLVFVFACVLATQTWAMTMQQLFDSVNAQGNVSNPAILQGQTLNLYTGGSLFMRMPRKTYNLVNVTPPSWNAGCGGIDLFMGGFSFINKDAFVAMLRNIGSNALGYGFKLAIQNLCPTCDNVMQALQASAQMINRQNIDSCETAKGIVNAALPDTWTRGKQDAAKNFGVNTNLFSDLSDAWTNVMNNEPKANDTINQVAAANPAAKDAMPTGNVVWKALKKLNGIDDEYRMIIMSMVGTAIFPTDGGVNPASARVLPALDISLEQLVGKQDASPNLDFTIWRCDTTTDEGCLNPYQGKVNDNQMVPSFRAMVRAKLWSIADKIAARQSHDSLQDVINFINVTDLPVYKMIAVGTTMNNTGLADAMVNRYQDLIAAKYAEVYIRSAVSDLVQALVRYQTVAASGVMSDQIKTVLEAAERVKAQARQQMAAAYTQTMSTFNMVQEVQFMERALSANLSQTLRSSLTFGRSLR